MTGLKQPSIMMNLPPQESHEWMARSGYRVSAKSFMSFTASASFAVVQCELSFVNGACIVAYVHKRRIVLQF